MNILNETRERGSLYIIIYMAGLYQDEMLNTQTCILHQTVGVSDDVI